MRKLLYFPVALTLCLLTFSCTRDVYQRPVTINKLEFTNNAGQKYDYQFSRVNHWFLQKIEKLEEEKQTFRIDTTAKKRYRKYNYTLVASLDNLEINNKPGVYYQLYLRPNSGIGKIKGGVQDDMYNELKLFSPEELFLQHEQQYYTDSIVAGPFNRLVPVQELFLPENTATPGLVSIGIDSLNFPKKFNKRQKSNLTNIINNTVVQMQQNFNKSSINKSFKYYQNFNSKAGKEPTDGVVYINVTEDPIANTVTVQFSSPGVELPKYWSTKTTFNRQDFLKGHTYQANQRLRSLTGSYVQAVWRAKVKQAAAKKDD